MEFQIDGPWWKLMVMYYCCQLIYVQKDAVLEMQNRTNGFILSESSQQLRSLCRRRNEFGSSIPSHTNLFTKFSIGYKASLVQEC